MEYVADPFHSDIEFKVRHLMISSVRGRFNSFRAGMEAKEKDFSDAEFWCIIDSGSLDTAVSERDSHLREKFFESKKFPTLRFFSSRVYIKEKYYYVEGLLEIKGVRNKVVLKGTYNGSNIDSLGIVKHGFDFVGTLKRSDWNLHLKFFEAKDKMLVGDEIFLDLSLQLLEKE